MKVIVAGFSKTGTKSMNVALRKLGYKVYDFPENLFLLGDQYFEIVTNGWTSDDFKRMYENVDAVVDFPANFFWEEISNAFPNAKIVLTIREDEEAWLRSVLKQTERTDASVLFRLKEFLSPTGIKGDKVIDALGSIYLGYQTRPIFRKTTVISNILAKRNYRSHNAYVQHSAPKGKLLVYRCSEGWEPLCKFLGVPVPNEPFPHKNKRGDLVTNVTKDFPVFQKIQNEIIVSTLALVTGAIASGYLVYRYCSFGIFTRIGGTLHCGFSAFLSLAILRLAL